MRWILDFLSDVACEMQINVQRWRIIMFSFLDDIDDAEASYSDRNR